MAKFTLVFSGVQVGAGEDSTYGDIGHSGLVHVVVEADNWEDALVVLGRNLSSVQAPKDSPASVGPSVWERVKQGNQESHKRKEARRLAIQWLEANGLLNGVRVADLSNLDSSSIHLLSGREAEEVRRLDSLAGLLEGILGRSS
jgi:hypothetical protein